MIKCLVHEPLGTDALPKVPTTSVGGKTGKTAVLPEFCKIECGGGSGGHIMVVLPGPCARAAPAAPLNG